MPTPKSLANDVTTPSVTIVIPTYNRPACLQATIRQLLEQPFCDFELRVIDQSEGSDEAANRLFASRCSDVRVIFSHAPAKGLPNARNLALAEARGEIVIFVDDDVVLLSDDFIGAHVRCFDDPAVGGVTGRHVERVLTMNSRRTACHVSWGGRTIFNLFGTTRQDIRSCKGSNMSFRMAAVHQVGGFDRRTHMLEDTDFSVRIRAAGWRLVFEPAAEVLHLSIAAGGVRETVGLVTECRRFRSTAYYIAKHRGTLGMVGFVGTFTLIAFVRAWRFRRVGALIDLYKAAVSGWRDSRKPLDQAIVITA